jgi:hypothetical protein
MLGLAVLSFVIGIVLGTRYKVLVLLPAILCALPIALFVGLCAYGTAGRAILTVAASLAGLQIGYLAGVVVRHLLAPSRVGALRRASSSPSPFGPDLAH